MNKILTAILICMPMVAWGDDGGDLQAKLEKDITAMGTATDKTALDRLATEALDTLDQIYCANLEDAQSRKCRNVIGQYRKQIQFDNAGGAQADAAQTPADAENPAGNEDEDKKSDAQQKLEEAQAKLDAAKEKEQSTANRMLGGLTTLATGIGGMQLAQGIAEKRADSAADKDMDAYIATMRCTYGDGKSVKFSTEPIELPGGNNSELMKYRAEYIALAADLKERKTALNLKPGIEAEEILDKATMGLYDDENVGITGGTYASRYRATTQNNEKDEKGLASDKKEAKTRMIAGGVVAGVGVVGGIVGNSIINGKLGELIKKNKDRKPSDEENKKAISKLKSKARDAGLTDPDYIDKMDLESYNIGNYITVIDKAVLKDDLKGKKIADLCPTPQIECADTLLTEKSKKDLMGDMDVVGGKIGDNNSNITDVLSNGSKLLNKGK